MVLVASTQVSLLQVLCPNTQLSPYLLPLSSSADTVCLDCSLSSLYTSPLISSFIISTLLAQLQLSIQCNSLYTTSKSHTVKMYVSVHQSAERVKLMTYSRFIFH